MKHLLDTSIAAKHGVNLALFLEHLQYWTFKNLSNKKHIYDGLCWTYNTLDAFVKQFPYWTRRQIERLINNAVSDGLLIKGNYNQTKYDRTCWYALLPAAYQLFPDLQNDDLLKLLYLSISPNGEMEFTEWRNGFTQTVTPIPDNKPSNKPYINISTSCEMQNMNYTESDELYESFEESGYPTNQIKTTENDTQVIEAEKENDKSDYCENQPKKNTNSSLSHKLDLKSLLNDNPFQIPEQMIADWMVNRRKHITTTSWKRINKVLGICKEKGIIEPLEAFEIMASEGWQSMKVEWFMTKEVLTKQEAATKKSLELEQQAARRKQQEIESSKRFNGIVSQASEAERSKLRKMMGLRAPEQRGQPNAHN